MNSRTQYCARLLVLVSALSVAACAGTKVDNLVSQPSMALTAPPHTIAVIVENDSPPPEKESKREAQLADAQQTATALADSLTKILTKRHLIVVPEGQPSDLVLRCRIMEVRGGSKALRVIIGYGAGKAILKVAVSLNDPKAPNSPDLLIFEANATTGSMPGGGFSAPALVGDGVNALRKDGLPKEIDQTTDHIDEELEKYFEKQNWPYTADPAKDSSWPFG